MLWKTWPIPQLPFISILHVQLWILYAWPYGPASSAALLSSEHGRLSGRQGWNCLVNAEFLLALLQAGLSLLLASIQTGQMSFSYVILQIPFVFRHSVHLSVTLFFLLESNSGQMSPITK